MSESVEISSGRGHLRAVFSSCACSASTLNSPTTAMKRRLDMQTFLCNATPATADGEIDESNRGLRAARWRRSAASPLEVELEAELKISRAARPCCVGVIGRGDDTVVVGIGYR